MGPACPPAGLPISPTRRLIHQARRKRKLPLPALHGVDVGPDLPALPPALALHEQRPQAPLLGKPFLPFHLSTTLFLLPPYLGALPFEPGLKITRSRCCETSSKGVQTVLDPLLVAVGPGSPSNVPPFNLQAQSPGWTPHEIVAVLPRVPLSVLLLGRRHVTMADDFFDKEANMSFVNLEVSRLLL